MAAHCSILYRAFTKDRRAELPLEYANTDNMNKDPYAERTEMRPSQSI
jgi:hypothetical protein